MKKYRIHLFSLVAALGLSSCDDYLDINDSPNSPTSENVTPNLALGGAITQPYRTFAVLPNQLGNLFMNSWGANVNDYTGTYTVEFDLNIDNSFYGRIWENLYLTTLGLTNIQNFQSDSYNNHKAIAKIVKTFYFQYLVDLYGDAPYSQAHMPLNPTPAYDGAQSIYRGLVAELDAAVAMIDNAPTGTTAVAGEDPVFQGNMANWKRFANTLKMRLLIRESGLAASQAYITAEFNELTASGAQFLTNDAKVNPGYSNANNDKQNPFYNTFGNLTDDATPRSGYLATVATKNAIESLNGVKYGVNDPRISRLFKMNGSSWAGVIQGENATTAPNNLANIGPGLVKNSAQDGYIFTAAESYFLQSEAALKGYITGDPKALFETGIQKSFDMLGATGGAGYIASINSVNKLGWDGTTGDKKEAIMTQKWIALMGTNGIESWIEYTRTGYPVTDLAITATRPNKPVRLMYPSSEYTSNANNVPSQSQSDAFNIKVFWNNN